MQINEHEKVIFFFPYRGIGGVSVLFLNLARKLIRMYPSLKIALIDYPDGYMAQNCQDSDIEVWPLRKGEPIIIPGDSVFVMQSSPMWRFPPELSFAKTSRFLLWHLHPLNIVSGSFWGRQRGDMFPGIWWMKFLLTLPRRKKLRKLLELCHQKNTLVFMDGANSDMAQHANGCVLQNPRYLPVPSGQSVMAARTSTLDDNKLRCAWVGRLEDFKIPILLYTIERLANYAIKKHKRISFDVIGSGSEKSAVAECAARLSNHSFKVKMLGQMDNDSVGDYLKNSTDILFAMGISALDGARVGIPVVLLDFSYEPIKRDYVYKYLYQSERFILGSPITENHYCKGNDSLESILENLGSSYTKVAEKTLAYYKTMHAPDFVSSSLMNVLNETTLHFSDIESNGLLVNDPLSRIYYALAGIDCRIPSH